MVARVCSAADETHRRHCRRHRLVPDDLFPCIVPIARLSRINVSSEDTSAPPLQLGSLQCHEERVTCKASQRPRIHLPYHFPIEILYQCLSSLRCCSILKLSLDNPVGIARTATQLLKDDDDDVV